MDKYDSKNNDLNSNSAINEPSTSQDETQNIIPGFKTVDEFIKTSFSTIQNGIKSANSLPNGDNFKYYCCFPKFNEVRNNGINKIEHLMQLIVQYTGAAGSMRGRDTEEKFKLLVDANDILLDKTSVFLDEEAGIHRSSGVELIVSQTEKSNCGSWNTSASNQNMKQPQVAKSAQAIRLLGGKNIHRPQLSFKDKIDNSTKPWVPRIKEKPNAIKPLGIYLIDGENGQVFCHPYEFELDKFTPPDRQLKRQDILHFKPLETTPLILVEKLEDLHKMMDDLKNYDEMAVDLEHHSYRTFLGITCLMQISTKDTDYLIDTLSLRSELHILNEIFTDPTILKVFHGADSDILWLQRDLSLYIVNMFDTHQAAKRLNLPYLSLSYLLKTHCNVDPNKHFQLADWRIRPLPDELKKYAREDTHYLLYIKDILRNALIDGANGQTNILKAVYDQSTIICKKVYEKPICDEQSCMNMYRKSQKMFNNRQLYALKELYMWRDLTAREEDDSTIYVLPNHMLLNIAETLPREMQGILACCNPIPPLVRQNLLKLHKIILKAREQPLIKPILEPDTRQRLTQTNSTGTDTWIWSPHDIPHGEDIQANLPCLLDQERMPEKMPESSEVEHSITVFDSPPNSDDESSSVAKERLKKARTLFVSPYGRYKLVIPMVAAEEEAEQLRREKEEQEKLEASNNEIKNEVNDDTAERVERIHKHFLEVTQQETVQANDDESELRKTLVPLGSIPGAKKRKREISLNEDNESNDCNGDQQNVSKKQKNVSNINPKRFPRPLDAFSGSDVRRKVQKRLNRAELQQKGMLPRNDFNYKEVDFSSFQGGSESNPTKIVMLKQEKRKNKNRKRGGRKKKEKLGSKDTKNNPLKVNFWVSSRSKPEPVEVTLAKGFDINDILFKVDRKTIFIIHGFLSHGRQQWVKDMERALLLADDVNVVAVDWSAHGNTWNYYKAAVNAKSVGKHIAKFLAYIMDLTQELNPAGLESINWGPIHMIGHSLGAHICGIAANKFEKISKLWKITRITGLDPAQPCFKNTNISLDITDGKFIDIIHTNAEILLNLGLGLPNPLGHVDFYPDGGKIQISCSKQYENYFDYLGIPKDVIDEAICSHGRSYVYFTESIIASVAKNGTFWGHPWDRSYESALKLIDEPCDSEKCVEMGINANKYSARGSFFVVTSSSLPYYGLSNRLYLYVISSYHYIDIEKNSNESSDTKMILRVVLFTLFSLFLNAYSINHAEDYQTSITHTRKVTRSPGSLWEIRNGTIIFNTTLQSNKSPEVDCFGLGLRVAQGLEWLFRPSDNHKHILDVRFFLTSRNKRHRNEVLVGDQFGLQWTDFKIERKTIIIVHGFLSHGNQAWVKEMESALLLAEDVNVVIVDWSEHGNTWNYYKAAVNAKSVGKHIAKFLSHIVNDTIELPSTGLNEKKWGPIHMVGHSLGAHICGIAATEFKKYSTPWKINRITGLDPAQPCFTNTEMSLDKQDAKFVDIIHTNARLLSQLGLGLPHSIGHVDFYPNGGKNQLGCVNSDGSTFDYLGIPVSSINQAICSHGHSYIYFTESIIAAAAQNGTFWGHVWDKSYRRALYVMDETCDSNKCVEMGINSINYALRGSFFVVTSRSRPFYVVNEEDLADLRRQLRVDFKDEIFD
ncbi:uncharacterized protein Rrp6 [Chelonus insularis]|uniref:uncharacterized protein Rrp6 n=1 Tax=Chelonus insularis TaxID=460826 RepID=UPI00158C608F|nr:uncharacterized protein LOC118069606 [Chelonus insularis]